MNAHQLLNGPDTDARRDADEAFDRALASGRLSPDHRSANYVGHYMFMGPARNGSDAFKHRDTREYLK